MPQPIRLVSLNVERSKHLEERIVPFLEREKPDVACFMEVMEHDLPRLAEVVGKEYVFEPMCHMAYAGEKPGPQGVAIFSRFPLKNIGIHYYHGEKGVLHTFDPENKKETCNHMLLVAEIDVGGVMYKLGTTHFPVTPKGPPDDVQRASVKKLLKILEPQGELVFCGDFNAARGGEIAGELIARYKDNVPPSYTMSLDTVFHRAGAENLAADARAMGVPGYMVDYIFSTPSYMVYDFKMVCGVSDHCALVAGISKS